MYLYIILAGLLYTWVNSIVACCINPHPSSPSCIKHSKQLRDVAVARRSTDPRPPLHCSIDRSFFFPPDLDNIPVPSMAAHLPFSTHPLSRLLIGIAPPPEASIDIPDSFSQDACCFCTQAANVNSPCLIVSIEIDSLFVAVNKLCRKCPSR